MRNRLKTLLKKNYYEPNFEETERFINNFHQYKIKKEKEKKTNFLAVLLLTIIAVCGLSIILKENNNKLDIQTSSGEVQK